MKKSQLILIGLLGFCQFTMASNVNFLSHSALSFFTQEDWRISKTARMQALENTQDGQKLTWFNPKTGSHGVIYPYKTITINGEVCRHVKMLNSAHLIHEKSAFRYCKSNSVWKIM